MAIGVPLPVLSRAAASGRVRILKCCFHREHAAATEGTAGRERIRGGGPRSASLRGSAARHRGLIAPSGRWLDDVDQIPARRPTSGLRGIIRPPMSLAHANEQSIPVNDLRVLTQSRCKENRVYRERNGSGAEEMLVACARNS